MRKFLASLAVVASYALLTVSCSTPDTARTVSGAYLGVAVDIPAVLLDYGTIELQSTFRGRLCTFSKDTCQWFIELGYKLPAADTLTLVMTRNSVDPDGTKGGDVGYASSYRLCLVYDDSTGKELKSGTADTKVSCMLTKEIVDDFFELSPIDIYEFGIDEYGVLQK